MVISIISFIASVILVQVHKLRYKARDSVRLEDIHVLTNALALYYQDNGRFPCQGVRPGGSISLSTDSDFLQPLVDKGLLATNPKDPYNNITPFEYLTFKSSSTGSCGTIAHFGIFLENMTQCPDNGVIDPSDHEVPNPFGGWYVHCHYFFPNPLPPPCPNPYWLGNLSWPSSCSDLMDNSSTDDY